MLFVPWIFQRALSSVMGFTLTLKVIRPCGFRFFYVSFEGNRRENADMTRFGCYSVENLPLLWLLVCNRFLGWFDILHLMFLVQEFFCCLLSLLRAFRKRHTLNCWGSPTLLFCDATFAGTLELQGNDYNTAIVCSRGCSLPPMSELGCWSM